MTLVSDSGGAGTTAVAPTPAPTDGSGVPLSAGFYGIPAAGGVIADPLAPPAPSPGWYSPAPAAPQSAGVPAPTPFTAQDFPVQAPGAFVAPIGGAHTGSGLGFAGGGLLAVQYAPITSWSQSDGGQLAAVPFAPHTSYRAGLGGIGRVLAGLGLAGPHRLPRELERHAATRAPLTP